MLVAPSPPPARIDAPPALPLLDLARRTPAGSQPFAMSGRISLRFLVNYRIAPEAEAVLRDEFLATHGLEFDRFADRAWLSVCVLHYEKLGPALLPGLPLPRSTDVLYRLAVRLPGSERRWFLSLLNFNSSRLVARLGRHFAPHRFRHLPLRLSVDDQRIEVVGPGHLLRADPRSGRTAPPRSSRFASAEEAERFLLDLRGHLGPSRTAAGACGSPVLARLAEQRIDVSSWNAAFVNATFESCLLDPWVKRDLLRFDSVLLMRNIEQTWHRTMALRGRPA